MRSINHLTIVACVCLFFSVFPLQAQQTQNIIIVTLDGYRWQELFQGADRSILRNGEYVKDTARARAFHGQDPEQRRAALMPFFWDVIARQGQLYGNRDYGNKVNCTNHHLLSYPGYSEMLVGFNHPDISSNKRIENPHATVLEAIGKNPGFRNDVAAFATWEVFPFILRESKSEIYVNAGMQTAEGNISTKERELNSLLTGSQVRSDSLTFQYAMEYLKRERPRVTLISFDGTDACAHAGDYIGYLEAAHRADRMIGRLWEWVQSQPGYKDKTTLFITTDHGRGSGKNNWRKHSLIVSGSRQIWFAVMGPDTPAFGEMKIRSRTYQNQAAKTIAAFLGLPYDNERPVGDVVQTMISLHPESPDQPSARSEEPAGN
ncbi:MAG TPA: alkaline phosphatase family protein [Chryseosolibacter sp.]